MISPFSHNHSTGFSYAGLLCQKEYSVIVATLIQPKFLVSTIAHEIGHLFGLPHTEERTNLDKCPCHNICMMDSMVHRIDFKDIFWSECDKSEILRELKNDKDCLSFYSEAQALCGNKVVDPGEECDCGFLKVSLCICIMKECQKEDSRKCCDPLSCKFTKGSNCYKGNCCNNCQVRKASEKCHMEQQECKHGLCDGISSNCRIFLDYNYDNNNEKELTCNYGKDQCFKGKCIRRDSTCEILYGEIFFYRCRNFRDTLCGKIICEGYTIDYISNKYVLYLDCISTSDESKLAKDIYLVPNGIKCGENKICQNQKCINIEKAEKSLNYKICGRYGKMISKNNCECTNTKLIKIDGVCYLRENYSSTQRKAICILIIIWNFIYIKFLYKNYKRIIYDSKRHYITV
ncbi:hypothetical protein HZS_72 [Henneguya salminicola]|nr:hypothetical protein HZS_72 [Henneguya salminicola]